ncbi:Modulator of drug activity B [hydrothermal vent metagenome]|uniref:Modulator of drug activity B n=1 Tax=hydrothermal vent metagenome TaxID=652676 RepID=A0A3B0ZPU3_9ZZZZ
MKNILIINAYQFYEGFSEGKYNKTMIDAMQDEIKNRDYKVNLTGIETGYNIKEEVEKHLWADIIIAQSPVYWFGLPWIYKKYVDEIFTEGLVQQSLLVDDGRSRQDPSRHYGTGGKMQGKKYMLSLTWNAPKECFNDKDQYLFAGKSVDDIFIGNTANYKFCGAEILPSFSCYNVVKEPDVKGDTERLRQHLTNVLSNQR